MFQVLDLQEILKPFQSPSRKHHGTSGPMFVIGNGVKGGFYGEQPSLKNLYKNDLAVTTDFRDVAAAAINFESLATGLDNFKHCVVLSLL